MKSDIESGSVKDLAEIVRLNEKIFQGMYEQEPYSLEQYKEKIKDKEPIIFISKKGEEIIGDSIAFARGESLYVWVLGVAKEYQGKGIGSALLKKNEQFARENNYKSISVKVYNVSERMQQLLKQRGYQVVNVEKSKTDSKYDAIHLELKI
ncbi:MAG: GNAT family N-acetyltransferase [Parachlamydiales bacterium]|jgi:ribosomal protein S18 acetylase RimI-like enzyme